MLKIVKDTVPSLRKNSILVETPLSSNDQKFAEEMLQYVKNSQDERFLEKHPQVRSGIGLAAPQAGVNKKIIAIYFESPFKQGEYITHLFANPSIISNSVRQCYLKSGEGCLSVDEPHPGFVPRSYRIKVKAFDIIKNENVIYDAIGFDAVVLQHEIDHLSGTLFYDRINPFEPFKKIPNAVEL